MEDLKSVKISETEKNRLLIKNVNNRPNAMTSFGKAKLTAEQTKDLFDKQFELMVARHNGLCDETGQILGIVGEIITEQNTKLAAQNTKLAAQDEKLAAHDSEIAEQNTKLAAQDIEIFDQTTKVAEVYEAYLRGDLKGDAGVIEFIVVTELPKADIKNAIYLVPATDTEGGDAFDEYIYVNGVWERIGNAGVQIDLSQYATEAYVDDKVGDISAALDELHAYAEALKGGEA